MQESSGDTYEVDGVVVYKPLCSPIEKAYAPAIRKAYPGWEISEPLCPGGKPGHVSYLACKDGLKVIVHVSVVDYAISEEQLSTKRNSASDKER